MAESNTPKRRVLLVGWDAADWKIIQPLMNSGVMPTVKRLVETGTSGNLRTLWPALSPMLWTSIATGKRPYDHGIHGFTEPTADRSAVQPMTNVARKSKAVWNIFNQNDLRSIVVGWWPSHPAEPINGAMVSDYFTKAPRKPGDPWNLMPAAVHPPRYFEELKELRVHPSELTAEHILPFVPDAADVDQTIDPRLSHVIRTFAECTSVQAAATLLMEDEPWDFMAVYFDAIDHFCHGYMRYHPPQQPSVTDDDFRIFRHVVTTAYQYHDMMLARLIELAGDDVTVMLISDHGFHPDHLRPSAISAEPAGPAEEHRELGMFLLNGPGIRPNHEIHGASLLDITPTLLTLYGLPVGRDMHGAPLTGVFEDAPAVETIPSWEAVDGDDGQHPADLVIDAAESREALEQLIALGYIDRPSDNSEEAIAQCQRELDYNLARAYMDGERHGDAVPLLAELYRANPLEFRFGIQLANCLNAMGRYDDLSRVVDDLNRRWRTAQKIAQGRLAEVRSTVRLRREQWDRLAEMDEANANNPELVDPPKLAVISRNGKPKLYTDRERHDLKKIRAVARGNPQTLDFLAASVALARKEFDVALEQLEAAKLTESQNPGFQYQIGNVYLELKRPEDAEAAFNKALAFDELHANSLMGLCRTYRATGDLERAIECGRKAIDIQYAFPVAHYFLGRALESSGRYEEAARCYDTALSQNPNFADAHDRLATIYMVRLSDIERATHHTEAARALRRDIDLTLASFEPIELPELDVAAIESELPRLGDGDHTKAPFQYCLGQPPAVEQPADQAPAIIVSGLPRSGTSMMMQMLVAAGLPPHTDGERVADASNPKGYYEAELVKGLSQRNDWVTACGGEVIKVVSPLVPYLPQACRYRAVVMSRSIDEILESQEKMLERLNRVGGDIAPDELRKHFEQQFNFALAALRMHHVPTLVVSYAQAVTDPAAVAADVAAFLELDTDPAVMAAVVDPSLYRQRRTEG